MVKTKEFKAEDYLDTPEAIAAYLEEARRDRRVIAKAVQTAITALMKLRSQP